MSLAEINNLLKKYGHGEVSTSDIPYFLAGSESQTVTEILPVVSSLALEWSLIGMEKSLASIAGATLDYVLDSSSFGCLSTGCHKYEDVCNDPIKSLPTSLYEREEKCSPL